MGQLDEAVAQINVDQEHLRKLLNRLLEKLTAEIDAYIFEVDISPPNNVQSNGTFKAQTNDLEIIEGILVVTPVGTTSATLTLGDKPGPIPLQNTTTFLTHLSWPVFGETRQLTYAPANATTGAFVAIWGKAAPQLVPGTLHA